MANVEFAQPIQSGTRLRNGIELGLMGVSDLADGMQPVVQNAQMLSASPPKADRGALHAMQQISTDLSNYPRYSGFADYLASAFPKPNLDLNHRCAAGHRAAALRLLAYPGIIWGTLVWVCPTNATDYKHSDRKGSTSGV